MKKRILSLLLAVCLIASLLPLATLAAEEWDTPWIAVGDIANAVAPTEGGTPYYFKTDDAGNVTAGGDESNYQVKVYFPQDGVPTVVLNGAYVKSTTYGICIGRDAVYTDIHNYPVDIIIKENSSIYTSAGGAVPIKSFATMDLTIKSENGKKLDIEAYMYSGNNAAIRSTGNIKLEKANLSLWGSKPAEADKFIFSASGNITIDGGKLHIVTGGPWSGDGEKHVVHAPNGKITIENGADVNIWNKRANGTFVAGQGIAIKGSSVQVTADGNGSIFGSKPTLTYANGYDSAASTTAGAGSFDGATRVVTITAPSGAGAYSETNYADYKYVSISSKKPYIAFGSDAVKAEPVEGGDPIYFKVVNGVASAGTEDDHQIVVTYPLGGTPTVTMNGAHLYNTSGFGGMVIGKDGDTHPVDIVVTGDSSVLSPSNSSGYPCIVSKTTGEITFKSTNGSKLDLSCYMFWGNRALINATGNVKFENINMSLQGTKEPEADKMVYSANGSVIISGATMQIVTGGAWSSDGQYPVIHAPNGKITIENGADVTIWNKRANKTFVAGQGITIKESNLLVAATGNGTIFGSMPTLIFDGVVNSASATAPEATGNAAAGVTVTAPTDTAAYNEANYATYKYISIVRHIHTPAADDGDCTTAVACTTCSGVAIPAKPHIPVGPDDGDCTTPVACQNCTTPAVAAKVHTGGTATCIALAVCTNEGCGLSYGSFGAHNPEPDDGDCSTARMCTRCPAVAVPAGQHSPEADDGDCTTAVNCATCGSVAIPAKTHTGGRATCIAQAVCANSGCGLPYGPYAECVPGADDGDCTTAILCTVCGAETTPAKPHTGGTATCRELAKCDDCGKAYGDYADHISNIDDGDCTTAVKCFVCGAETVPAGTHTGGKATCKKLAKCENCGQEYGELAAHTPGVDDGDCTTAVNCTYCGEVAIAAKEAHTPGTDDGDCTTAVNCTECGKVAIAAKEHTPGAAATCTTAQTCTACGTELAAALGHSYEAVVTNPDCVNGGYTTYTCSVCGDTYTDDEVDALGHTAGDAATCTTAQTCTVCGAELAAALGHTPGDAATCTTAQKCTVCEAELAAAKGHTPGEAATCTTAQKCTVCEAELAAAKGHTPGEAATCTTAQKCTVCDAELAAAKGHTPAADDGDCTTAIKCSVCGAETTAAKEAHTYTDNKDTTCDNEGCTNIRKVEDTSKPGTNGSPQTGDANEIVLFVAVLSLLAAGFVSVVVFNKKRNAAN